MTGRRPGPDRARMMRVPTLFVAGLLLLLAGILGLQLYRQYHDEIRAGEATARSLTTALEEHAGRTFSATDVFLQNFAETLNGTAGTRPVNSLSALRERMNARLADLPQIRSFIVLDDNGDSVLDSATITPRRFNGADRDYFLAHAERAHVSLFISTPLQSRITGKWMISLSRRVTKYDGSFGGVVAVAVDPDYFQAFYRDAQLTSRTLLTLLRDNGVRLARVPDFDQAGIGSQIANWDSLVGQNGLPDQGEFASNGEIDGIERVIAYRRVSGFPLLVAAGLARGDLLATWRENVLFSIAALLLAGAAGAGFLLMLRRQMLRTQSAELRLRDAIESLSEGFALYDSNGRIVTVNSQFYALGGHDPQKIAAGNHNEDIMAGIMALARESGRETEAAAYVAELRADFENPSGEPFDIQASPGRWLRTVRHRTADGGVIAIISDISDLKLAGQRLRDAIESLPDGFALYGPDHRLILANRRLYELTGHDPEVVKPGISHGEIIDLVSAKRRQYWPDADRDGYDTALRQDQASPSGEPIDSQYLPGRWLRSIRRRTTDGGTISVVTDITDLKLSEQRLHDAIESLSEGFTLYGPDNRLRMANRRFYELSGHDPEN